MSRTLRQWIEIKRRRKAARRKIPIIIGYIAARLVVKLGEIPADFNDRCWWILFLADLETYRWTGRPLLPGCRWVKGPARPLLYVD